MQLIRSATRSSETSVLARDTRRQIPEDNILQPTKAISVLNYALKLYGGVNVQNCIPLTSALFGGHRLHLLNTHSCLCNF
jgi:hypothetical protein